MYLFRTVMDKEIVDRDGRKIGKVDDLLLELRPGQRPVVRAMETGQGSLAHILGRTMTRVTFWLREKLIGMGPHVQPALVDWDRVTAIGVVVHVDVDREEAGLVNAEQAIWQRWICRLPWAER